MTEDYKILEPWGWNKFFEAAYSTYLADRERSDEPIPARVIGEEKGFLRIVSPRPQLQWARFRKKEANFPAVGDWIVGNPMPGTDRMLFEKILPRRTWISRREAGGDLEGQVIGANLDTVFIVTSLNADFNPKRVERYMALALDGGTTPVVILSKADLVEDVTPFVNQIHSIKRDVQVISLSLVDERGLDLVSTYVRSGETLALVGSSGVGKSSLVNYLMKSNLQKIKEIRSDDKGKHTTTSRMLFQIPGTDCCIMDTPGMREVGLWIEGEGLKELYDEISFWARACRFRDCLHEGEPECAVRQALAEGKIAQHRYDNFLKMQKEAGFISRKDDPALNIEARKKWKQLTKSLKQRHKQKGKK